MDDQAKYPKRPPNFFFTFLNAVKDSDAKYTVGHEGCWLLTEILLHENNRRWTGPAKLWNSQLEGILRKSQRQSRRIRDKCVEFGWLHYEAGTKGIEGVYWVTIPDTFMVTHDQESQNTWSPVTTNPPGIRPEYGHLPVNKKEEIRNSSRDASASRKRVRFSDDDKSLAAYIWHQIRSAFPETKEPNLNNWSNDVRLMCERDGRTHKQIRKIFDFAHADEFWRTNILSPQKLRKQFDILLAKTSGGHSINGKRTGMLPETKPFSLFAGAKTK